MNPVGKSMSDIDLSGKVAIVTGASRGIGQELVRYFSAAGAMVFFCARREEPLKLLSDELSARGIATYARVCDVTDPAEVHKLIAWVVSQGGKVDILINNVGIAGPTKPLEDTELLEWNETIGGNLTSTFLCMRAVVPVMKLNGGGSIVNISSVTGKRPLVYRSGYAAAKMGVIGLTRTSAEELGPFKIRVNAICPGAVEGERLDEVISGQADLRGVGVEQIREMVAKQSPLGELVRAVDVARAAAFLASDISARMTGQDINVTAGAFMS